MSLQLSAKYLILILSAWAILTGCSTPRHSRTSKNPAKQFYHSHLTEKNFTGLAVYDPKANRFLFKYQAGHTFTPASNTKLLTFYTGLNAIGDSIPGLEYCISNDTLYFGGTGDPTFLNPAFKDQPVFDFLKESSGPLAYFDNLNKDERFGPGWAWDDYLYDFSPEKATFPIYGNVVHFRLTGHPDSCEINPGFFASRITISGDSLSKKHGVSRPENENTFAVTLPEKDTAVNLSVPFKYSENLMLDLLGDTLHRPVIHIKNKPRCKTRILFSRPADSVFRQMLLVSDNFIAEQILLMGSYLLFDTLNSQKMIHYAREHYLPELDSGSVWVDGSGLSRYNQFSPEDMVYVLKKLYEKVPKERLFRLMPHGKEVSLVKSSGTGPYLIAKTGSMSYVYNLSGFLRTKKNKILIFSFMNNNFTFPVKVVKSEMAGVLKSFGEAH